MNRAARLHPSSLIPHPFRGFMKKLFFLTLVMVVSSSCHTVGVSTSAGGFAEVSPTIANEMILDTRQVVILDTRPAAEYRGPSGHIAGAISAPFDTIEKQLPELLPYQNDTVLVYGANA